MGLNWSATSAPPAVQTDENLDAVVIIGAGIIGLSTAYSLALSLNETELSLGNHAEHTLPRIIVVDPSQETCPAASSRATGVLGTFGPDAGTESYNGIGSIGYRMHVELAEKYNGKALYGFSEHTVYRLNPKDFGGDLSPANGAKPNTQPTSVPLEDLPSWVKASADWEATRLSTGPYGLHLDPKLFCPFLTQRVKELGVEFEMGANVTSVSMDHTTQSFSSVEIRDSCGSIRKLPCRTIVLAAGPWSDRVFSQLFPRAKIKIPMDSSHSAGNHIRLRIKGWQPGMGKDSVQVYYNNVTPDGIKLDITSFTNGDLYIGGWGAIPGQVPDLASDIEPQPSEIKAMLAFIKDYVEAELDDNGNFKTHDAGRCIRPMPTPRRPIITKVDWGLLDKAGTSTVRDSQNENSTNCTTVGGLVINTGHSSDGIALGFGSGQVASELVLGKSLSVPISQFDLPEGAYL